MTRKRRTKTQIETLEAQILGVLYDDHPQSVRHVFYRMTNPRLAEPVEKTDHGYCQVQHLIAKLRRTGVLRYDWITDATRRGYHVDTFSNRGDFLRRVAGLYRSDLWASVDTYVEVWCESRSIAGVIEDDCRELAVSLYPAGGFSSMTLAYQAAEYINAKTGHGEKEAHVIYIGDYDPAGVLIDRDIEKKLREHLSPDVYLTFDRIAVNTDQIVFHDLPTKPRKSTDKRALHIQETVEAEAIPAQTMRNLLRGAVEEFLPPHALEVSRVAEASEQEALRLLAASTYVQEVRP